MCVRVRSLGRHGELRARTTATRLVSTCGTSDAHCSASQQPSSWQPAHGVRDFRQKRRLRHGCFAAASYTQQTEELTYAEEDFYSILGVSPFSDARDIKRAYYAMVRDVHPDKSCDEDTTEFCVLLNDIYETLSDPDKRAVYDELAGFSDDSVNPFLDSAFPRDQVFVDEFACIGCYNCAGICPKTFDIEDEHGRARAMRQGADDPDKIQEAIDSCPVSCIHWVSQPQLPLLEAAMAKMGRVAVWNMMSGKGANMNVFVEASLAWEKRQSEIRAKRAAATAVNWTFGNNFVDFNGSGFGSFYEQGAKRSKRNAASRNNTASQSRSSSSSSSSSGTNLTDRDARSIAGLAAKAARVARTWKQYQDVVRAARMRPALMLSSTSSVSSGEFD